MNKSNLRDQRAKDFKRKILRHRLNMGREKCYKLRESGTGELLQLKEEMEKEKAGGRDGESEREKG